MRKFKMMIGVNPGYGHENEGLTPEIALNTGKSVSEFALVKAMKICRECKVSLASAVYPTEFGAPAGGELGVVVEGEIPESEEEKLLKAVEFMMGILGQNTVVVEFSENGKSFGSAFLSEGGKKVSRMGAQENELERFITRIPKSSVGGNITKLGSLLQSQMTKAGEGRYLITGIITEGKTEEGVEYYEYSGTQNPSYGQASPEIYGKSSVELIHEVAKAYNTPLIVELNHESVIVEPEIKQLSKEKYITIKQISEKINEITMEGMANKNNGLVKEL